MRTLPVTSLVQGVSQQSAQQRRTTQCEQQYDCLNSPVEGVAARPGFDVVKKLTSADLRNSFQFPIFRGVSERYQAFVLDGNIRVFNLLTGNECTVTKHSSTSTYLNCAGSPARVFKATSAEDVTFVVNSEVHPAMAATLSPARPKEALIYFKAGSYKAKYSITLYLSSTAHKWEYETPDNSVAGNEEYIRTDAICYALFNAMDTDPVNSATDDLGFHMQRVGCLMRIWRTDALDFEIEVSDGLGNTQLLAYKERVAGFDKLPPSGGFDGMIFKIMGDSNNADDDYFVEFVGKPTTGVWEECVAPATPVALNTLTMPYRLINTGLNTFTFDPAPWGERICGDEETAPDPSFIGKPIVDLAFDNARLMIETQAGAVWGRTTNPYVFFPDTVQTALATDPVDYEVKASKKIAIMKTILQTDDDTFLWAEGRQFRVSTADQPFSSEAIAIKPSSAYDFNANVAPVPVGRSVMFVTENGPWSSITDILIVGGSVEQEAGLTDHCPKYVPKNVEWLEASDTAHKAIAYSSDTPQLLYLYEWHLEDRSRLQSAWSTWRLPEPDMIPICAAFDRNTLYLVVYRPDGTWLLKLSVSPFQVDGTGKTYLTRLDMRVTEADMTVSYNAGTDETRFLLPYLLSGTRPYRLAAREDTPDLINRGTPLTIDHQATESGKTALYVIGDNTDVLLYGGYLISAEREESRFFVRDSEGNYIHMDRLQVNEVVYAHSDTAYYRVEVLNAAGDVITDSLFEGRVLGDPSNLLSEIVLNTGSLRVPINRVNDQFRLRLVNDSYFPSAWQSANWGYVGKQQ